MYFFRSLVILIFISLLWHADLRGQNKALVFIKHVTNDQEISKIYNEVEQPLMIIDNSVYVVDASCITESFGGQTRGSADGSVTLSQRNSAEGSKTINQRESAEGSKVISQRESAGGSKMLNERESAEGNEIINKPRESAEGNLTVTKPRESNEGAVSFYCEINSSGTLLIYLPAFKKKAAIRIYYKNTFIDGKYFKIKTQ